MSVRSIGEKAALLWRREGNMASIDGGGEKEFEKRMCTEIKKWVPNLYVNNSDYTCCYYTDPGKAKIAAEGKNGSVNGKDFADTCI